MPTFDGVNIFGYEVVATVDNLPRAAVQESWFGIDGIAEIDGGFRGRIATIQGKLQAPSPSDLGSMFAFAQSYHDGKQYTLALDDGRFFTAKMLGFHPHPGRSEANVASNQYQHYYAAEFLCFT